MLLFVVYVGTSRYAIEIEHVVEVLPRVNLNKMLHAPHYVSGVLNFEGTPIPVVDLCLLMEGRSAANSMHTRILLCRFTEPNGEIYQMGLMAEKVTQTIDRERKDFIDSKIKIADTFYLDGILTDEEGVVQLMLLEEVFNFVKGDLFQRKRERR